MTTAASHSFWARLTQPTAVSLWVCRVGIVLQASLFFSVDWASKVWIRQTLPLGQSTVVWPGVLDLTHVQNTGAAWSLFNHAPQYLVLLALVFSLGLLLLIFLVPFRRPLEWLVLSLLLGGAVGNLWDRLQSGAVTDFIDAAIIPDYPIFNVADICIFFAVVFLITGYLKGVWPRTELS